VNHNAIVTMVLVMPTDNLAYAGVGVRMLALLIDYAVLAAVASVPVMGRSAVVGPEGAGWEHFAWVIALSYAYFLIAQSSKWHCTLGKKLLGLKVSDLKGGGFGFGRAHLRCLFKLVFFPLWFVSIFYIVTTPRKQALHDEFAGTVVLREAT
jgi:uncharacterized RDD family membrane protein YckC